MNVIRDPAVAGMFYPADTRELKHMLQQYLQEAQAEGPRPKAIIVPHAGYIYSGPIAASAYVRLKAMRTQIHRVVLLGPSHRVGFRGLATSSAEQFRTPLGAIPLDREAIERIESLPHVERLDQAHLMEHSLEVHLPFLQTVLNDFTLVPIVVGDASAEEVSAVIEALWGGEETLIVISSDLSHYHDYQTARSMDQKTSRAIEELRYEDLHFDDACGRIPISGLLASARKHHLQVETIDLRNSGDTAGSMDSVVGYGAYVIN